MVGTCAVVGLATMVRSFLSPGPAAKYGVKALAPKASWALAETVVELSVSWSTPVTTRKLPLASTRAVATILPLISLMVTLILGLPEPTMVGVVPTVRPLAGAVINSVLNSQLALLLPESVQFRHTMVLVRASESLTFKEPTDWDPLGNVMLHLLPGEDELTVNKLPRAPDKVNV